MYLLEEGAVEIRPSKFGKGLFATRNLLPDNLICKIEGDYISFRETLLLGDRESHSVQTGIDRYILCDTSFVYSNHSCNPNCAINHNLEFFTLKPIKANQELLWDYSTSMLERHWTMKCLCSSKNCRKTITDFDLLPAYVQEKYLSKNITLPFIIDNLPYKLAIGA